MPLRINNLRISLDDDISELKRLCAGKLKIDASDIRDFKIIKESVDARHKSNIGLIYSVELVLDKDERKIADGMDKRDVVYLEPFKEEKIEYGKNKLSTRPIIIGSGPAGLFAGLSLAKSGYKPVIFERGKSVDERLDAVQWFWKSGDLDPECNIQFGEGGAGTFSDGKLTTRIRDVRCDAVLKQLVASGAPSDIMTSFKPHIGTDILKRVVSNIRNEIIRYGGEVYFSSKLTAIKVSKGLISGITINDTDNIDCSVLILAIGHSARDTVEMLSGSGVLIDAKPFAVGFRVEHKQSMIDEEQYGKFASHPKLKAADYRLAYHSKKYSRPCYSFCMCPGGIVVAAASEKGRVATNGMSEYARDGENANSALVCGVNIRDFKGNGPMSGIEFQRRLEETAYRMGGGGYVAPVQRIDDFIKGRVTKKAGNVKPSYTRGYRFNDLNNCLPEELCAVMKEALADFDKKIRGFASEGIMTAVETRTSSPVRIERGENYQSKNIMGLYPAGEGAGYAGGIISAAVDGMRVSEEIMRTYAPFKR